MINFILEEDAERKRLLKLLQRQLQDRCKEDSALMNLCLQQVQHEPWLFIDEILQRSFRVLRYQRHFDVGVTAEAIYQEAKAHRKKYESCVLYVD